jgi:hypothetical protein
MATADRVTTRQLCEAAGISYRQADYWCRMGYLLASEPGGSGTRRTHPRSELMVADGLRQVIGAGCLVGGAVADTLRDLPPGWTDPVLLDEQGRYTDDLDVARWVVQPHPDLVGA